MEDNAVVLRYGFFAGHIYFGFYLESQTNVDVLEIW